MNAPHGDEAHTFDLRCEECQAEASAEIDARFMEEMAKAGLTPEQAQDMLDEARRRGRALADEERDRREQREAGE